MINLLIIELLRFVKLRQHLFFQTLDVSRLTVKVKPNLAIIG